MRQAELAGKMTWDDWGLILSDYQIGEADPKTEYVDIPFGDGSLDLTEAVSGEINYKNRPIDLTFTITQPLEEWSELMENIRATIHGRRIMVRLPDDPGHYYMGRCTVDSLKKAIIIGTLGVSITADPYRYKNAVTVQEWTIGASGSETIILFNSRMRTLPTVTVSASTTFLIGSTSTVLATGSWEHTNLLLSQGYTTITVTAVAGTTVKFEYQEGAL